MSTISPSRRIPSASTTMVPGHPLPAPQLLGFWSTPAAGPLDQRWHAGLPPRQELTPERASLVPGSRRVTIGCRTGISMHRKAYIVSAEANLSYVEGYLTEDEPLLA